MQDVVYAFLPNETITVLVSLCDSMYDNILYVYQRQNVSQTPTITACSDDACGISGQAQVGSLSSAYRCPS